MKISIYPFLIILIFSSLVGVAQENPLLHRCGYDLLMEKMEIAHPGYKENYLKTFDNAQRSNYSTVRADILTIPLVIHIVYQNQEQNLSDQRVNDVVESLNKDFRHENDNAAEIRSIFLDNVSDPMIQFDLKEIKRVSTTSKFKFSSPTFTFPDHVKLVNGGSTASNTTHHLNVWVCNIEGGLGLLGYSYPPTCAPNWPDGVDAPTPEVDGVVVHFEAFNVNSSFVQQGTTIDIEGRTLTHEIGHYLGLRHIWGDGFSALLGTPDCIADDGILDTPQQGLPSQLVCNKIQNTCTDATNDKLDMIENYMDYSDEGCMSTFTKGQTQIMRGTLMSCRKSLIENVAVIDKQFNSSIIISPNPTSGQFTISTDNPIDNAHIYIYNNIGKLVYQQSTHGIQTIDLSDQLPGMYYLHYSTNDLQGIKKLVIVK